MRKKFCILLLLFSFVFSAPAQATNYVVMAWNDLGMHCYNHDFQDLAVLPPYNTLWAQVIEVGNPPRVVTQGISVSYSFPNNTYSVGKSNFWDYEYALFGVNLPPNIGLTGKGLSGTMDRQADHFVAEGIPLTEYQDSAPNARYPYQLAEIVVRDSKTQAILAELTTVAPASTEMKCDNCHYNGGVEGINTGRVETNILTLHDEENMDDYPPGHKGPLMGRRPVLCAECHASNALGASGVIGIPNLSRAMHKKHDDEIEQTTDGCYQCHPGPQTKCLRGVMSSKFGMSCIDCHGDMNEVAQNSNPWLNEPRCDSTACHGPKYAQNNALYRMSSAHGGVYCAACHDSPHAIATSRELNDSLKFIALQGKSGTLAKCTVCHTLQPNGPGPHGITDFPQPLPQGIYLPLILKGK